MLNLLPSYWQKKLEEEELFKTVAILGTVAAAAAVSFVLMLFLVRIYCSVELKDAEIAAEEKGKEMEILDVKKVEGEMASQNKFVANVKDFYSSHGRITDIFLSAAEALPEGVTLSSFGLSGATVRLSGYSPDRNSLVVFKSSLEKVPSFKKIVFPPENWLTAQSITFDINLEYEP